MGGFMILLVDYYYDAKCSAEVDRVVEILAPGKKMKNFFRRTLRINEDKKDDKRRNRLLEILSETSPRGRNQHQ